MLRVGWTVLLLTTAGCLLYTDKINHAPKVSLTAPASVGLRSKATFVASASDEDQAAETLTFAWWVATGDCPTTAAGARAGEPLGTGRGLSNVVLERDTRDPFCVSVVVNDDAMAESFAFARGVVGNGDPVAQIKVVAAQPAGTGPYDLYSTVRLSGAGSNDPEGAPLTLAWSLQTGSTAVTPQRCPDSEDVCVRLDHPGSYAVTLTAADDAGGSGRTMLTFLAADDRPPCIARTSPEVLMARLVHDVAKDGPLVVSLISVDDDGDPFPVRSGMETASISWRWDFQTELLRYPLPLGGEVFAPFRVESLQPYRGHDLIVRLSYEDRVKRAGCPESEPFCAAVPDSGCYQRVTWTISVL